MNKVKRPVSLFLPIKIIDGTIYVYLQRRSADMVTSPNYFGFWGGGAEFGETPDQALIREVKEELGVDLDINELEFFNHYEFLGSIIDVYLYRPEEGWEKTLVIGEGDYGQWFSGAEIWDRADVILQNKVIFNDLDRKLFDGKII